jgi:uncharacterized tellurite resistance protein B-like protein
MVMALELNDLSDDERVALVALVQLVAEADTYVTAPEAQKLRAIIRALGEKSYTAASDAADERFEDTEALKTFLRSIERQEARELIYETALEVGLSDARIEGEKEIFDWLARTWELKVRVVEESPK